MYPVTGKPLRIVFDTNTVVSALLFTHGRLAWLRRHWSDGSCVPPVSPATTLEIVRVLSYPKFRLTSNDHEELLGDYLPFCDTVEVDQTCPQICRDPKDQPFLDLAQSGNADALVTGDSDLLALADRVDFRIETPQTYRLRQTNVADAI